MPKNQQRVIPRLKPVPYTLTDVSTTLKQPQLTPAVELNQITLYNTPDLPNNKRGFKYQPCRPNPYLHSKMYSTTDLPPYGVHWSYFDRSSEMYVSENLLIAGTLEEFGWRSTRSNIAIREGRCYVEYKIVNGIDVNSEDNEINLNDRNEQRTQKPHVRIGLGRREGSLEAPVGFDGYSYGIRDVKGEIVHLSKRTDIGGVDLCVGDIIGLLIELPTMELQKEISKKMILQKTLSDPIDEEIKRKDLKLLDNTLINKGIERDMIPIKYKGEMFFEEYEYTESKAMEHLLNPVTVFGERAISDKERFKPATLPGSSITLFVNGKKKCVPFEKLYAFLPPASEQKMTKNDKKGKADFSIDVDDGSLGYYPMVSSFCGGAVEINSSNDPWIMPEDLEEKINIGEIKMYGRKFNDKVVQDVVVDVIDDAINKYLDRKEIELEN